MAICPFIEKLNQAYDKESINAPHHWPFVRESTDVLMSLIHLTPESSKYPTKYLGQSSNGLWLINR